MMMNHRGREIPRAGNVTSLVVIVRADIDNLGVLMIDQFGRNRAVDFLPALLRVSIGQSSMAPEINTIATKAALR